MTIVSGGMLVVVPLLYRAFLLAGSEPAAQAILDLGLYILFVVALFFVPLGMAGFQALQVRDYGFVGHTGFLTVVIASIGLASGLAGYLWWEDTALLWLASPAGTSGLVVGFFLYGAATLHARVLPRWCGITLMGALPTAIALMWIRPHFGLGEGSSTTSVLSGLAWLALGYTLWTRTAQSR